jgi:predicted XRE-type DNA-binding protein
MGTNVFADAGYAADDATIMAIRSDLAMRIAEFLERSPLNQVAAARRLEVPQPTISKIVNGRIDSLSIELLIRMLVRADVPIVIQTGSTVKDAGAYVAVGKSLATSGTAATSSAPYSVYYLPAVQFVDAAAARPRVPRWRLANPSSGVAA